MAPFDRSYTTFHWSAIVNIAVRFLSYLTLNNIRWHGLMIDCYAASLRQQSYMLERSRESSRADDTLSSNWHVTLLLTVFEIFAVKRPNVWPKILNFWYFYEYRPQKGRSTFRDLCPSCKISRQSVAPSPTYLSPYKNYSKLNIRQNAY